MNRTHPTCRDIEPELVAVGAGEASPAATQVVEEHVARCAACRDDLQRYRALDRLVADMRLAPLPAADPALARAQLESRLADLRRRLVTFGIFSSPLGPILIARSEEGVSMVEYLESEAAAASHLARLAGVDAVQDEGRTEALYQDLLAYLDGRRTRLDWPLDLRLASSDFQRRVLRVTSRLPYGAVTSYSHIAREIGEPRATRAVAQALRRNPLPIVIPCHRVIGSSGDLTGYAGNKVALKQRLLTIEGVPVAGDGALHIERQAMYVRYQALTEYCLPTCGALPSTPLAELTLFGSRQGAEAVGLTPCSDCRPDLHPLPASAQR
jgi:methylated-DNA-[protein]-cysteine S-methyltransferase